MRRFILFSLLLVAGLAQAQIPMASLPRSITGLPSAVSTLQTKMASLSALTLPLAGSVTQINTSLATRTVYVSTISALTAINDASVGSVIVRDARRGGIFTLGTGYASDGGVVFPALVPGSTWIRQYSGLLNAYWWGCRGLADQDESPFLQAAVNYAKSFTSPGNYRKTLFMPAGYYSINTTVNCTDANGLYIVGEGGRYINTIINANTGGIGLDFSGSSLSGCENLMVTSPNGLPNPSIIGIQFALNKDAPNQATAGNQKGGLNCTLNHVNIFMGNYVGVNGGLGSIGLVDCRSEEIGLHDVMIQANTGAVFTTNRNLSGFTSYNYTVSSAFTPIQDDGNGSMGVINWSGNCSIQCWEHETPALVLNGVNSFHYKGGYLTRLNNTTNGTYEPAVLVTQYTYSLDMQCTIEGFGTAMQVQATLVNSSLDFTVANQGTSKTKPLFVLTEGARLDNDKIRIGFGNSYYESVDRYLFYVAPVNGGNSPTTASIINCDLGSPGFLDNNLFMTPALLKQTINTVMKSGQPFEKRGNYIVDLKTYDKGIGVTQPNNAPVTASLIHFTNAYSGTATTGGNAGYYNIRVKGTLETGYYTTNNGPCIVTFEGYISFVQNVDGTLSPVDSKVVIVNKTAYNPGYLDITDIALSISGGGTVNPYSVDVTVSTGGAGAREAMRYFGVTEVASNFSVKQSVIFD